jgi:hypothetical protein
MDLADQTNEGGSHAPLSRHGLTSSLQPHLKIMRLESAAETIVLVAVCMMHSFAKFVIL